MAGLFDEYLASTLVGGLAFCIGLLLLLVEQRTRGSRAIVAAWLSSAVVVISTPTLSGQVDPDHIRLVERLYVLPILVAFFGTPAYLRYLMDTAHPDDRARSVVRRLSYLTSGIGVAMCAVGALRPDLLLNKFMQSLDGTSALGTGGFWLFGAPTSLSAAVLVAAWVIVARQELDPGERSRAIAYSVVVIPLLTSFLFPTTTALLLYSAAVVVSLYGILIHLTVQGERAAFLSRFLSPQVAELVRLRGLPAITEPSELQISVVCIDFRGFTAYTEAIPSQAVIDLLSDYHEAIAEIVANHDGMIKDYAGDGILILVGAPIAREDHAQAAVALARDAQRAAQRVTDRWATGPHPLGVGIGIASGRVTVGAIGKTAQMEYAAVGTPVNLAARLCSAAEDGAILLDERAARVVPDDAVLPLGDIALKGLSNPVAVFQLKENPGFEARSARTSTSGGQRNRSV